jgi:hypothetical protein
MMDLVQWFFVPLTWLGVKLNTQWFLAMIGLPLVVFGFSTLWWVVRRRWRRLALLLVLVLLLAAGAAVWRLATDDRWYDPGQYYDWYGWYEVLGYGVYFTGVLLLAVGLLRPVGRAGIWLIRRLRARHQPAPAGA